jgi:hypothetical protein
MPVTIVPTSRIRDWETFHDVFAITLALDEGKPFAARCPEQYAAVIECAAFVNWARIEEGERPILALSFYK